MKKHILTVLYFMIIGVSFVFSSETSALASVSASSIPNKLFPIYKNFGEIVGEDSNPILKNFSTELKKEFSFDWTEKNFSPDVKVMLSRITPYLSKVMPIKSIVFSPPQDTVAGESFSFILVANDDKSYSGSAVVSKGENSKILALSLDIK